MSYYPSTPFVPQFFTDSGVPLSGGILYAFLTDSTTPTPMYIDDIGTSAGVSITLNARGEPQVSGNTVVVWLDSAILSYKFVLKDALGVSKWTANKIDLFSGLNAFIADLANTSNPALGAGMVGYKGTDLYNYLDELIYFPDGFVDSVLFFGNGGRSLSHTAALDGYYQVGVGMRCMTNVTTGSYNTGVGFETLEGTTTGSYNSGFGEACLIYNVTGEFNTACGWKAGVGQASGHVSASYNTWIGAAAGIAADSGDSNTGVGAFTLQNATMQGSGNSTLGRQALSLLTTGDTNTAVGYLAGQAVTTGSSNSLVGYSVAFSLTTGSNNTIHGDIAGYELTTGSNNVFIGSNSGRGVTTGSGNVCIGHFAGAPLAATTAEIVSIRSGSGNRRLTITDAGFIEVGAALLQWTAGTGSPEGVVTAPIGSLYSNLSGGASTTLYVKTSGAGNTGWTAK